MGGADGAGVAEGGGGDGAVELIASENDLFSPLPPARRSAAKPCGGEGIGGLRPPFFAQERRCLASATGGGPTFATETQHPPPDPAPPSATQGHPPRHALRAR